MSCLCGGGPTDVVALVAYVPDPLAALVDRVRREITPGCSLRAHITVLPPRAIAADRAAASGQIESVLSDTRAFRVSVGPVTVFPVSNVIYLGIVAGSQALKDLHYKLNQGCCRSTELWRFEPHLTLAQDLDPNAVAHAQELAEKRWHEYAGPHDFTLDNLTFVKGDPERGWVDLTNWELPSPVLVEPGSSRLNRTSSTDPHPPVFWRPGGGAKDCR